MRISPPGNLNCALKWRNILVVRDIDPLSMACRLFQNYFRIVCSKTSRNFHWLLNGKTKMYFFQNIVNEIVKTWRCDVTTHLRYVFHKNLFLLFTCMCWSVDKRWEVSYPSNSKFALLMAFVTSSWSNSSESLVWNLEHGLCVSRQKSDLNGLSKQSLFD